MKVFQVNDCDWVAAKSFEEAKEWYMKEYGFAEDEIRGNEECSLEEAMWVLLEDVPEEERYNIKEIKNDMAKVTFKWVMENIFKNYYEPYLIATTEY